MMRAVSFFVVALAIFGGPSIAADALNKPFGIERGQKLSALDHPKPSGDNEYDLLTVPEPHPLLSFYRVTATEQAGVCSVIAATAIQPATDAERDIATISDQLAEVFSKPLVTPMDVAVGPTGVWVWMPSAPGLGLCGLKFKKGELLKKCLAEFKPLPSTIKTVAMYRFRKAGGQVYARLEFTFDNDKACRPPERPNPFR
jgi:hypothetical protein